MDNLYELIRQRNEFELQIYDFLVNPIISDDFWEPVKVSFKEINKLKDSIKEDICHICTDKHLNFKKLNCCNQEICNGCCHNWFNESVKCPFCFQDLRDFN
jgi:hypothetical protein